jgi:hypothetical protein
MVVGSSMFGSDIRVWRRQSLKGNLAKMATEDFLKDEPRRKRDPARAVLLVVRYVHHPHTLCLCSNPSIRQRLRPQIEHNCLDNDAGVWSQKVREGRRIASLHLMPAGRAPSIYDLYWGIVAGVVSLKFLILCLSVSIDHICILAILLAHTLSNLPSTKKDGKKVTKIKVGDVSFLKP